MYIHDLNDIYLYIHRCIYTHIYGGIIYILSLLVAAGLYLGRLAAAIGLLLDLAELVHEDHAWEGFIRGTQDAEPKKTFPCLIFIDEFC